MNQDLKEQFQKKNDEVLMKKITIDLEKNSDSLKQTIYNAVNLNIVSLKRKLFKYFDEIKIEYDKEALKKLFQEEQTIITEIFANIITLRTSELSQALESSFKFIEKGFVDKYSQAIDENRQSFESRVKSQINEETLIVFSNKIYEACKFTTEDSKNTSRDIMINVFQKPLVEKANDENELRNNNLKNFARQSFLHYTEMNKATVDNYTTEKENKAKQKSIENIV